MALLTESQRHLAPGVLQQVVDFLVEDLEEGDADRVRVLVYGGERVFKSPTGTKDILS